MLVVNGEPVRLRGWNLGCWLVLEGYALGVYEPGYQSHEEYLAAVGDLIGAEEAEDFIERWRRACVTEADLADLAARGFNTVRVPFRYDLFYDDATGQLTDEGFGYLDPLMGWARKHGVYVILDLHAAPLPQSTEGHAGHPTVPESPRKHGPLWDAGYEPARDLSARIWGHVAQRYRDEPALAGYDLLNEPVIEGDEHQWKLRDFYVACTRAIRRVDPHRLIWAEGTWYGVWLQPLLPRWDEQMGFSIHNYWTDIPSDTITEQAAIAREQGVPLWLGETGENSTHWYHRQRDDLEARGVHWTWWAHKLSHTKGLYSFGVNPDLHAVNEYWAGRSPRPSPEQARRAFEQLLVDVRLENATLNFGVLDALTRDGFDDTPVAYRTPHRLPGRIAAVDYDSGANGVAYHDEDFQTTAGGPGYVAYNRFWGYRNDGVDIRFDEGLGRHVVAAFHPGEWLSYTLDAEAGTYTTKLKLASPDGGVLALHIQGRPLPPLRIPPTPGTPGPWLTLDGPTFTLPRAGPATLRVEVLEGSVDFEGIDLPRPTAVPPP